MTNTNTNTNLTFVLTADVIQDRFDKVVVLRDELVLTKIGMTVCHKEVLAVKPTHAWLAEDYADQGILKPVKVRAVMPQEADWLSYMHDELLDMADRLAESTAKDGHCDQCGLEHAESDLCCRRCGYDLVVLDEGNDPYGQFDGTEQEGPNPNIQPDLTPVHCLTVEYAVMMAKEKEAERLQERIDFNNLHKENTMYDVTFTTNFGTTHDIKMDRIAEDGESPFIDLAMEEFSIWAAESGMDRDMPGYAEDLEITLESCTDFRGRDYTKSTKIEENTMYNDGNQDMVDALEECLIACTDSFTFDLATAVHINETWTKDTLFDMLVSAVDSELCTEEAARACLKAVNTVLVNAGQDPIVG